jgi:hypothetical protein
MPRVQVNMAVLQTNGAYPFIDLMKGCQGWSMDSGYHYPGDLDANGYPNTVVHGSAFSRFFYPSPLKRPGDYVMYLTGKGTAGPGMAGSLAQTNTSTGVLRYQFTPTVNNGNLPHISAPGISAVGAGDYIRSMSVMHVDDETRWLAGDIVGTRFKELIDQLRPGGRPILRFMDMTNANSGNASEFSHTTPESYYSWNNEWSPPGFHRGLTGGTSSTYTITVPSFDNTKIQQFNVKWHTDGTTASQLSVNGGTAKPLLAHYGATLTTEPLFIPATGITSTLVWDPAFQGFLIFGTPGNSSDGIAGGVPYAAVVKMAREIDIDPWMCLPHNSVYTNFAADSAAYMRDNLNVGRSGSNLLVHIVEYCNEVWNPPTVVTQWAYKHEHAISGLTENTNEWFGRAAAITYKQVHDAYSGDTTRYATIGAVWTAVGPGGQDSRFTSAQYVSENGGNTALAAYHYITHYSHSCYWDPADYVQPAETAMATEWASATPTRQWEILSAYVNNNSLINDSYGGYGDGRDYYIAWHNWAAGFGITQGLPYEGAFNATYFSDTDPAAVFRQAAMQHEDIVRLELINCWSLYSQGCVPSLYHIGGDNATTAWPTWSPDVYTPAKESSRWKAMRLFAEGKRRFTVS